MFARLLALVLLFTILPSSVARAWGDRGHMLVALLAYRKLDASHKAKVDALLREHPHYELYLTKEKPNGTSTEEWAFVRAATWPDFVRKQAYSGPFHNQKWHFINLPFVPPAEAPHVTGPAFQVPVPNVLHAIDACRDILKEEYPSDERKAIHLAWLEHTIGDMHQPLHCAALVTRVYPRGDFGGNSLAVRVDGHVKRLHGFWDNTLADGLDYAGLTQLAGEIESDAALSEQSLAELASNPTHDKWAQESFEVAKKEAYLNGVLPFADYKAFEDRQLQANQVPVLDDAYRTNARKVVRRQAALAGFRLAATISEAVE